jgi:hypothetical protein
VGEEPTLDEIEKILADNKDKAVEGFYVTGHLLEDKLERRGANFDYVKDIIETFRASRASKDIQIKYSIAPEKEGYHHKINVKAIGAGGSEAHDVTFNYFVMDEEKEKAEKEELEVLLEQEDPMVFENKKAKHGILDARIVDKYEIAANLGAMFGYVISIGDKEYAQFMGVRFALMAEKIFGKKK